MLVITGGVPVGDRDLVQAAIERLDGKPIFAPPAARLPPWSP